MSEPLENLAVIATPGNAKKMTATWTRGTGSMLRSFVLTLDFPYNVNIARATEPKPSDPTYTLTCTYATAQPVLDLFTFTLGTTTSDSTGLVQLAPPDAPPSPGLMNRFKVAKNGVSVDLSFREGLPLLQGSPPMIFKTYLLDEWTAPGAASGGKLPSFATDSYFSRTLLPGHHNFVHSILLEPAVDPALAEATRDALAAVNIRYLYLFHDSDIGTSPDDIRYLGFDNTLHGP